MKKKILVIDTSILCVWLEVPGMESCGPDRDRWTKARVDKKIGEEQASKQTDFVLPLATIIETGNHISQCSGDNFLLAKSFCDLIKKSAESQSPWIAFTAQTENLWSSEMLLQLVETWPALASQKISLGDATIKDVAEYYARMGYEVEIFTGDQGLKAYEPTKPKIPVNTPRWRSGK